MKSLQREIYRYAILILLIFISIRFFPLIVRLAQFLILAIRGYWWILLPVFIAGWRIIKSRRQLSREPGGRQSFGAQPIRDVTHSVKEATERSEEFSS
jgi:hypothetical protein